MDFESIGRQAADGEVSSRKIVEGRRLMFDADFACYEVAVDLEENVKKTFKRLLDVIDFKRRLAGAEFVTAFITLGKKSGREEMATVQEYQENRDPDKPIKVRVRELRDMLAAYKGDVCEVQHNPLMEADDFICVKHNQHRWKYGDDSSVIMSGDKDLWMIQGLHCDAKTGRLWRVDGYGKTEYREVGNVKPKLVGEGTSWFWHQMIMGDKVDNIPGLPKITNEMLDRYQPLKSGKRRPHGSTACGEAKAVTVLKDATNDIQAATAVYELYHSLYGKQAAIQQFMEQAYLLWMQREPNGYDVENFFADLGFKSFKFSPQQREIIDKYNEALS